MNMTILMVGGGGREHALIKKLKESPKVTRVICAPGNGGIACDAKCFPVQVSDIDGMVLLAKQQAVDLVFVAPDDPLAAGMVDRFEQEGIRAYGPSACAAVIESSKVFAKNLMKKYAIPTASYEVFDNPRDAVTYILDTNRFPVVIKADGLALGKGVIIAENAHEAKAAIASIMEDRIFGASGNRIVVEEFLSGPEVSVLAFTDGKVVVPMVSSMDHKRAYDNNKGPNTGGMGTISPNPHYTVQVQDYCMDNIFLPTIRAMQEEGCPFKGCLYFGLMLTNDGPKVIEYNARFGDPETQVVLPRLLTPLIDIIEATINETLETVPIQWDNRACACVVLASGGYPASYKKGIQIDGLDSSGQVPNATVYHAGTTKTDDKFFTNGGRVLGVTSTGDSLQEAIKIAYTAVGGISFDGMHYRGDIGRV